MVFPHWKNVDTGYSREDIKEACLGYLGIRDICLLTISLDAVTQWHSLYLYEYELMPKSEGVDSGYKIIEYKGPANM